MSIYHMLRIREKNKILKNKIITILISSLLVNAIINSDLVRANNSNSVEQIKKILEFTNKLQIDYSNLNQFMDFQDEEKRDENVIITKKIASERVPLIVNIKSLALVRTEWDELIKKICTKENKVITSCSSQSILDVVKSIETNISSIENITDEIKEIASTGEPNPLSDKSLSEIKTKAKKVPNEKINKLEQDLFQLNNILITNSNKSLTKQLNQLNNILTIINLVILLSLVGAILWFGRKIFNKFKKISESTSNIVTDIQGKNDSISSTKHYDYESNLDRIDSKIDANKNEIHLITNSINIIQAKIDNNSQDSIKINKILCEISQKLDRSLTKNNLTQENEVDKKEQKDSLAVDWQNLAEDEETLDLSDIDSETSIDYVSKYYSEDLKKLEKVVANYNAKVFNYEVYKVASTRESIEKIRTGVKVPLIFKIDNNDSYWILLDPRSPEDNYYLVPKPNLIINEIIHETVGDIFICHGYQNRASNKFKLIYPAEVKFIRNNEWKLLKSGELRFDVN